MLFIYVIFGIIFGLITFVSFSHDTTRSLYSTLNRRELTIATICSLFMGLLWPLFVVYLIIWLIFKE